MKRFFFTFLAWCVLLGGLTPAAPAPAAAQGVPDIVYLGASPNPVQVGSGTEVIFDLERESVVDVSIVRYGDGGLVRQLANRTFPRLRNTLPWDGRDAQGQHVPVGHYIVVATVERSGTKTPFRAPLFVQEGAAGPPRPAPAQPTAAPAPPASKLTRQLVIDSYREVFNRAPTEAEIAFWLAQPGTDPRTQSYAALVAWHREFLRQQGGASGTSEPPVDLRPPTQYREAPASPGGPPIGVCRDPWITKAIHEVLGRAPRGYDDRDDCNITNYNNGSWASYEDLVVYVGLAYRREGYCKDPWINHAIRQVLGRLPDGRDESGECRPSRYGGGSWSSFDDLVAKVRAAFGVGTSTRTLMQAPAPAPTKANRKGPFVSNQGGLCMDVIQTETGRSPGSKVVGAFACHGADNQQFEFDPMTGLIRNGGLCLTAAPGAAAGAAGDPIEVAACHGDDHYLWRMDPLGRLWGISNRCIGVGPNNRLLLQDCTGVRHNFTSTMPDDHQRWEFRPVYRGIISAFETGWRQIARCLDKQAWGSDIPIVAFDCHGGDSQQFLVEHDGTIRSYPFHLCLDGRNGHGGALLVMECDGSPAQKWYTNSLPGLFHTLEHKEPGQQGGQIQNQHNNLCIDIKGASTDPNVPVIMWRCEVPPSWYQARPWNQMFGIGQYMSSTRALVIQRNDLPPVVGHTGWAIELEDGRWLAGAWDGISAFVGVDEGAGVGWIKKGSPNGHWKLVFNTKEEVLDWFSRQRQVKKFPSEEDRIMPYNRYHRYKEFTVENVNTAAVFSVEAQSWGWGYGVLANNCMDVSYKLLKAYGVQGLPGPSGSFDDWLQGLGVGAGAVGGAIGGAQVGGSWGSILGPWGTVGGGILGGFGGAAAGGLAVGSVAVLVFDTEWIPNDWFNMIGAPEQWLP
jgi:hypothetical protein